MKSHEIPSPQKIRPQIHSSAQKQKALNLVILNITTAFLDLVTNCLLACETILNQSFSYTYSLVIHYYMEMRNQQRRQAETCSGFSPPKHFCKLLTNSAICLYSP